MAHGILLFVFASALAGQTGYKKAPERIRAILDAPAPPGISVSPARTHALLMHPRRYPPVAELAQPMLRLAGLRINPANNAPHRGLVYLTASLVDLATGKSTALEAGNAARLSQPYWSPDGSRFAFLSNGGNQVELWIGETSMAKVRRIDGVAVNSAIGEAVQWMPGSKALLVQTVPAGRDKAPQAPAAPTGPVIQETSGKSGPARTYQDLLANPHDELLFEYYATSQLAFVDTVSGRMRPVGKPAIYTGADPSPDGKHLLVTHVHRPFSYLHPYMRFPREVEVWNLEGTVERKVASHGLQDRIPIDGVPVGPRSVQWSPNQAASLQWVEALDGGNPKERVPHRDRIVTHAFPFTGEAEQLHRTEHRLREWNWVDAGRALIADYDRDRRWVRTVLTGKGAAREIWSRSAQDRYGDPGNVLMGRTPTGHRAALVEQGWIYLQGDGSSPKGDRPFLDRMELATGKTERLFQSDADSYEAPVAVLPGGRILTRRESPEEPPNFLVRSTDGKVLKLTEFRDPAPELRKVTKQLVSYQRADGVPLSFTLYLPPGYKPGTRLPAVLWAYPLEYNDASTAGQVSGSTKRFTTIAGTSHLFLLLAGYAILDGATMPVVGHPETANNTYLEQIVASAKAAIDKAAEMGVVDPNRVGVSGHSYGGFMTANLLAHSDLFRAGVARSGAYNRTLTPFGFQSERRTFWEASETYAKMSPFFHAHQIKEPVLFIHGEADNNAGTFPIQSDRMYQAVKGNGGTARFVLLPHESHGYEGRESVEHTLAEMIDWFDTYLK